MSEFKFGYESQNHKIEIQIPVCLLGKPDPDAFTGFTNLIGKKENTIEPEETEKEVRPSGLFRKRKSEKTGTTKTDHTTMDTIAKTSALLLSSMVLAALKD